MDRGLLEFASDKSASPARLTMGRNLLEDIVECILDSYEHWWPRSYCRLALISSVWLQPVRRRLYEHPFLGSYRSCHHLARTLDENPSLVSLIRELDLHPMYYTTPSQDDTQDHVPSICPGVPRLLALTHLRRLTLSGDLEFHAEQYLRFIAFPHTIASLQIICPTFRDFCEHPRETLVWDGELASRFCALESLAISGPLIMDVDDFHYSDGDVATGGDTPVQRGCMLKELLLEAVMFTDHSGPLCAIVHAPSSWRNLRTFTFTSRNCSQADLTNVISVLALAHDSLEELTLFDSCIDGELVNHLRLLLRGVPPFSRLRSLKASHVLLDEGFRHIIFNVESVDLVGDFCVDHLLQWATKINSGMLHWLPKLRKFFLRLDDSPIRSLPPSHNALATLTDACQRHDIRFDAW